MSAESPSKPNHLRGHTVSPQPVNDRSIIENVAGFINEVVPQGYSTAAPAEGKEAIQWARFECGDINDPMLYPESSEDHIATPPLLLVLGYGSGVQVWAIPASGEATEVFSSRQGVVRTLRIIPTPRASAGSVDVFSHKRPLIALCDSAGPGPQFCSVSFISLRSGEQVRSIKFKNPVSDVVANQRAVVITFPERIAVFSSSTLEDCMTVTTCYPCPGPNPNPVALGERWLAYAERRLLPARRSSGGTEADGVQSYTATVLHAAKSFGKGLRELGETVASSLTGGPAQRGSGGVQSAQQTSGVVCGGGMDTLQPGVVTILDTQAPSPSSVRDQERYGEYAGLLAAGGSEVVAHFMAHSEAVVALAFDPSGMLLLTADKRGHDFHLFRVHPHPAGSSMAAVHHLYILHRGDTTAKVQGITFAADSRWVAVSTMRGTTHVFPITPYGGTVGVRTHASPHVVNRLSRFHRSAGLTTDGRNSPVPLASCEVAPAIGPAMPHANPRLPPYPHPTIMTPLAQIRQPFAHTFLSSTTAPTSPNLTSQQACRNPSLRTLGRTQSSSDEGLAGGGIPLKVAACFAPPRAWLVASPTVTRESSSKAYKRVVDSLFVMTCHGTLIEYDLEPRHAVGIPKEKVCDDTPIDLEVEAKAQWLLLRPQHSSELQPPLPATNPLMALPDRLLPPGDAGEERWLSQVEIVTHAGPHRRLWMGPQFTFKTYTSSSSSSLSLLEVDAVEVGMGVGSRPARSNPVNMPLSSGGALPVVPVLIESGSASSYEQSPTLLEVYGPDGDSDSSAGPGETQLKEDLADAMLESPGVAARDTGRRAVFKLRGDQLVKRSRSPIEKVVNPVGSVITVSLQSDDEEELPQRVVGRNVPSSSCTVIDVISDSSRDDAPHQEGVVIPSRLVVAGKERISWHLGKRCARSQNNQLMEDSLAAADGLLSAVEKQQKHRPSTTAPNKAWHGYEKEDSVELDVNDGRSHASRWGNVSSCEVRKEHVGTRQQSGRDLSHQQEVFVVGERAAGVCDVSKCLSGRELHPQQTERDRSVKCHVTDAAMKNNVVETTGQMEASTRCCEDIVDMKQESQIGNYKSKKNKKSNEKNKPKKILDKHSMTFGNESTRIRSAIDQDGTVCNKQASVEPCLLDVCELLSHCSESEFVNQDLEDNCGPLSWTEGVQEETLRVPISFKIKEQTDFAYFSGLLPSEKVEGECAIIAHNEEANAMRCESSVGMASVCADSVLGSVYKECDCVQNCARGSVCSRSHVSSNNDLKVTLATATIEEATCSSDISNISGLSTQNSKKSHKSKKNNR